MTHSKPPITSTKHVLPFDKLSPLDFERLCLWLVEREGYERAEHLGLAGSEQGRDVIAYKPMADGEELWYFQCKRYASIRAKTLKDEVDKYLELVQEKPHLRPTGVVFVVSCAVSAKVREEVGGYCGQHKLAYEFWALTELDLRVNQHPDLLREFFGLPTRPVGVPFQAPPLPSHFIPRPEVSNEIKARLLADETAMLGVLVVSAIHGLGGIGKSVLACALTYDHDVQQRFPNGILWATLGQQPELITLLSDWIQALGDYEFRPTTVQAASGHLRTLLHDKATLLVVDDVWDPAHAPPFQVGGPHCQILITTRRADVAEEVGAALYQLDVMTETQSLDLLSIRLGRPLANSERKNALRLARAVGYLPLALELAAARIARGVAWIFLCEDLEQEIARLEALEGPRRRHKGLTRLEASLNLSLNALRDEDETAWKAFVWLGVLPEDAIIAAPMAATLWEMEQADAAEILELLWNDALLLPGPAVPIGEMRWPSYRLHDLLHDTACRLLVLDQPRGLGITLAKGQAALLERYQARAQNGLWHTLPDDGYIHVHLALHMERAGWKNGLHTLLQEETSERRNGWFEARERLGQTAGYLRDVTRAWQQVTRTLDLSEAEGTGYTSRVTHLTNGPSDIGKLLALEIRYALITSSLNSLAHNIPPSLLVGLVENGVWTPAQGLAYACRTPNLDQRVEALVKLSPHLSKGLLLQTLETVRGIEDKSRQVEALVGIAPHLPEHERALVLQQGVETAWEMDATQRAKALANLALYLPEPGRSLVVQKALETAQRIEDTKRQAGVLAEIVPRLAELGYRQKALEAAQLIQDQGRRAEALASLPPHLPKVDRAPILQEALEAARQSENERCQVYALVRLASDLPDPEQAPILREALETIQQIESENRRAHTLCVLAPHLPEILLREALQTVQRVYEAGTRAYALAELAPYLPEILLREALEATQRPEQGRSRMVALEGLAPRLAELGYSQEALEVARGIDTGWWRASALAEIVSHVPEPERAPALQEALEAVQRIGDQWVQEDALAELAIRLAELGDLEDALETAWEIRDFVSRTEALAKLVPYFSGFIQALVLEEALRTACEIRHEKMRVEGLMKLLPYLQQLEWAPVVREILKATQGIENIVERERALEELAGQLAKLDLPQEALEVARGIENESSQVYALTRIIPHLPEPERAPILQEALEAARAIENERSQVTTLTEIIPHLPEPERAPILQEALEAAREIKSNSSQVYAVTEIIAHLSEPERTLLLRETLEVARGIEDKSSHVRALAKLIPHLPESEQTPILREALEVAREGDYEYFGVYALTELISHLPESEQAPMLREALEAALEILYMRHIELAKLALPLSRLSNPSLLPLWRQILPVLACHTRKDLLSDLRALTPVVARLGGKEAITDTVRAIRDVGRWWQ